MATNVDSPNYLLLSDESQGLFSSAASLRRVPSAQISEIENLSYAQGDEISVEDVNASAESLALSVVMTSKNSSVASLRADSDRDPHMGRQIARDPANTTGGDLCDDNKENENLESLFERK